jgi:ElaB/YqjD/DUF883 family membrane-anchored ribosome-binding protein
MKKYLSIIMLASLVLSFSLTTFAKTDKGQNREEWKKTQEDFKVKIKANREEAKKSMEDLKTKIKTKIEGERIAKREDVLGKLDRATTRISDFIDKVNTHITDLGAKGVDVTEAQGFLDTAQIDITDAKAKIAEANGLLSTSVDTLTTDQKAQLKTLIQDIENLLKDARTSIISAVKSLKDAVKSKIETEKPIEDTSTTDTANNPQ